MDSSLLTSQAFWDDCRPFGGGGAADFPELAGHVLFETSGSTGFPKHVALSKTALLISAAAVNGHLKVTRESCWGLALPLNHVGGFGVVARAYQAGSRLESFGRRWEPSAFGKWLAASEVSHTSLVPTQVHDLVAAGLTAPPALRAIVVGGGCLDERTGRAARDLGWPVLASYGMTEAGSQIATQGLELLEMPYRLAPIKMLPIWQAETTADGILSIAGPALFSGYLIGLVFSPRRSGHHVTSDRVLLENGVLTPLGRADRVVKILGELVDPESVEREVIALSACIMTSADFVVLAMPDERAGYTLVPVFESSGAAAFMAPALAAYQLTAPGFRRLGAAVVAGAFPRSPLGKLRQAELEARLSTLVGFGKPFPTDINRRSEQS